jgi:hypothetical protein
VVFTNGRNEAQKAQTILAKAFVPFVILGRTEKTTNSTRQVYFDTNRLIRNTFGEAGFPGPGQFVFLKNSNGEGVALAGSAAH